MTASKKRDFNSRCFNVVQLLDGKFHFGLKYPGADRKEHRVAVLISKEEADDLRRFLEDA